MNSVIWKPVVGYGNLYEDLYEVSNDGQVRRKKSGRILRLSIGTKGYYKVRLSRNGIGKSYEVQRLVALAFIDNPNNYPIVNHIDENPLNNSVDNLEWCTYQYNLTYGKCQEKRAQTRLSNSKK